MSKGSIAIVLRPIRQAQGYGRQAVRSARLRPAGFRRRFAMARRDGEAVWAGRAWPKLQRRLADLAMTDETDQLHTNEPIARRTQVAPGGFRGKMPAFLPP